MKNSIFWFRKSLRLHDNPALNHILQISSTVYPIFILDPYFTKSDIVGVNRMNFLLESLRDLDDNLRKKNSRLIVLKGKPTDIITQYFADWKIDALCYELDTEPYARKRDEEMGKLAQHHGVTIVSFWGHTLYDLDLLSKKSPKNGVPLSYKGFLNLLNNVGKPPKPVVLESGQHLISNTEISDSKWTIPTLSELGYQDTPTASLVGGESHALFRLDQFLMQKTVVCGFSKPDTDPTLFGERASTTILSPYLKFGCLSARTFYYKLTEIIADSKKHTNPPESLLGQLLWREFFYLVAYKTPHFDRMEGNPICKQIPWDNNLTLLQAWSEGQTGYPWIDAAMQQLKVEGWMHHLARHAVACFLTRGDLWQSWVQGVQVFDRLLLDADWSLNNANWMWLSCSAFFHQYYRVYSPITFPKKYPNHAAYIKHFIPVLQDFPDEYILNPWKAPLSVQKKANCVIGEDYPHPIVQHDEVKEKNISRMKAVYDPSPNGKEEESVEEQPKKKKKISSS